MRDHRNQEVSTDRGQLRDNDCQVYVEGQEYFLKHHRNCRHSGHRHLKVFTMKMTCSGFSQTASLAFLRLYM